MSDYPKDSYWTVLKERAGQMAGAPMEWLKQNVMPGAGASVLNPNARPTAPAEAMPGNIDPIQRQALIDAILQRQQQGGQQGGQPVDQRQLILQEAQRRGIPIPPDSPLNDPNWQPQQQPTPDNPAGIQF